MKKFFSYFKISKEHKERFLFILLRFIQWTIILLSWVLFIGFLVAILLIPYVLLIVPLLLTFLLIFIRVQGRVFVNLVQSDTIVYGPRGSGKGLLFQYAINNEKRALSNLDYGSNVEVVSPFAFFESIRPNTFLNFINHNVIKVDKNKDWEGVPYYLDDTNVYFPNSEDSFLTKYFKSMSVFLTIQRHLYGSYTVINAQSIERIYKKLRELNLDGYILARGGYGLVTSKRKQFIWKRLPILRKFVIVKYRYYSKMESAVNGLLPFNKIGLVNKAVNPLLSTTPEALRQQYKATNGTIQDGFLFIRQKDITYNSRYFSDLVFNKNVE